MENLLRQHCPHSERDAPLRPQKSPKQIHWAAIPQARPRCDRQQLQAPLGLSMAEKLGVGLCEESRPGRLDRAMQEQQTRLVPLQ